MRILQVLLSPRIGGAESAANSLASVWREEGHEVFIAYLDSRGVAPLRRLRHLRQEVHVLRPDVVVSHSALPSIYSRLAVSTSVAPVVCVLHSAARDLDDVKLRFAEIFLRHRAAAVVAVSAAQVVEYQSHFPREQVDLVPNGVGEEFSPSDVSPETFCVVSVGRVARQKDPYTWAGIASQASADDPRLHFEWVGPTGVDSEYERLERVYQPDEGPVRFVGPTDDVASALRRARVMLHTAEREAHSVALLEAAASGLPIVCTEEVGRGLPDWIVREEFTAGDVEGGLAALRRVVTDVDSFSGRARMTAPRVFEEFGVRACARRYVDIFQRVL